MTNPSGKVAIASRRGYANVTDGLTMPQAAIEQHDSTNAPRTIGTTRGYRGCSGVFGW
jgi:hypothetical protein